MLIEPAHVFHQELDQLVTVGKMVCGGRGDWLLVAWVRGAFGGPTGTCYSVFVSINARVLLCGCCGCFPGLFRVCSEWFESVFAFHYGRC